MNFDAIDSLLKQYGRGCLSLDDPFFRDTHEVYEVFHRCGIMIQTENELCPCGPKELSSPKHVCDVLLHTTVNNEKTCAELSDYKCKECNIAMPNARLLEIHVQEMHDSYFLVAAQKQPMHQCYVEECNEKFVNPQERKSHCETVHQYPVQFPYEPEGATYRDDGNGKFEDDLTVGALLWTYHPDWRSSNVSKNFPTSKVREPKSVLESGGLIDLMDTLPDPGMSDET